MGRWNRLLQTCFGELMNQARVMKTAFVNAEPRTLYVPPHAPNCLFQCVSQGLSRALLLWKTILKRFPFFRECQQKILHKMDATKLWSVSQQISNARSCVASNRKSSAFRFISIKRRASASLFCSRMQRSTWIVLEAGESSL